MNKSKAIQDYFLFRKWLLGILSNFMENTCNCQIIACKKFDETHFFEKVKKNMRNEIVVILWIWLSKDKLQELSYLWGAL